jgi:methionine-rich copper-binding protein CopC
VLLIGGAGMAWAHAVLLETNPPVRGTISGPEVTFRLRFNCRIDAARSVLQLVLSDGTTRPLAVGAQSSPDTLSVKASGIQTGRVTLRWQVLAADGHITRGELPFQVR